MALTPEEEVAVREIIDCFVNGKKLTELGEVSRSADLSQLIIEVVDVANDASCKANLKNLVENFGIIEVDSLPSLDAKRSIYYLTQDTFNRDEIEYYSGFYAYADGEWKEIKTRRNAYESLEKVSSYLYKANYSSIDYEGAKSYFMERYHNTPNQSVFGGFRSMGGLCTSIRKEGLFGRNLDWYYSNNAEFLIYTPNSNGRHAVMGMCGNVSALSESVVDSRAYNEMYRYLPFFLLDGINDAGLICSMNVVPTDTYRPTTGTNPGKESICGLMLLRYVLDHFSSAREAVEYIDENLDVYMPYNSEVSEELHYIIGDGKETYIVEFIDNACRYIKKETNTAYITNFHIYNVVFNPDESVIYSNVEPHGMGLERHDLVVRQIGSVNNVESMRYLLESLKYTNMYYDNGSGLPEWKTELVGVHDGMDYTVMTPVEDFQGVFRTAIDMYRNRDRNNPETWQSVHSAIYDLENRRLYLNVQEDYSQVYSFDLPVSSGSTGGGGSSEAVLYTPQILEEGEQMQARKNLSLYGSEIVEHDILFSYDGVRSIEDRTSTLGATYHKIDHFNKTTMQMFDKAEINGEPVDIEKVGDFGRYISYLDGVVVKYIFANDDGVDVKINLDTADNIILDAGVWVVDGAVEIKLVNPEVVYNKVPDAYLPPIPEDRFVLIPSKSFTEVDGIDIPDLDYDTIYQICKEYGNQRVCLVVASDMMSIAFVHTAKKDDLNNAEYVILSYGGNLFTYRVEPDSNVSISGYHDKEYIDSIRSSPTIELSFEEKCTYNTMTLSSDLNLTLPAELLGAGYRHRLKLICNGNCNVTLPTGMYVLLPKEIVTAGGVVALESGERIVIEYFYDGTDVVVEVSEKLSRTV